MSDFRFPAPSTPSLTATPGLQWGVVGTGTIAGDFTAALHAHTAQRVVAVTSRTAKRGAWFARKHGISQVFTDVHTMAANVDVVYIATPHRQHHDGAMAAIRADTPVLIEKPLGLTADETRSVTSAARAAGVFAAEAMWTRYQPAYHVIAQLLQDGAVGEVRLAHADVGWKVDLAAPGRILDADEGGGALLDMGIYSLWFAQFAIGHPSLVTTRGVLHDDVDVESATILTGPTGALATATSTIQATTDGRASIIGTTGTIQFLDHFVFPRRFAVTIDDVETVWEDPAALTGRDGLAHEAAAIAMYLAEGRTESPLHTLDDSVALATTMQTIHTALHAQEQHR